MKQERPFLQIPVPSPEDQKLYEEWLERNKPEKDNSEEDRVVVIEL